MLPTIIIMIRFWPNVFGKSVRTLGLNLACTVNSAVRYFCSTISTSGAKILLFRLSIVSSVK